VDRTYVSNQENNIDSNIPANGAISNVAPIGLVNQMHVE
jgi:hypothetical protein